MENLQDQDKEYRINEILSELEQCRDDERNSQAQLLQAVATGGAFLAIIFGATFFQIDSDLFFLLSVSVFIVVIGYLLSMGIVNVLRFHYMRDLEDQLSTLIPNNTENFEMIHWMSFNTSITTRNPRHLSTKYAWIHYFAFGFSTIFMIVFCVRLTWYQYTNLKEHTIYDYCALVFMVIFVLFAGFAYFVGCSNTQALYNTAIKIATNRRNERLDNKKAEKKFPEPPHPNQKLCDKKAHNSKMEIMRALLYFIYPKLQDIQKPFLIVIGYFTGVLFQNRGLNTKDISELLFVILIIDFLVYQSRFQWNDIRGLYEDVSAKKMSRLPVWILGKRPAVIVSFVTISVKMVAAFLLIEFLGKDVEIPLLSCFALVIIIAILYEVAREKRTICPVFFLVSLGYPLRFLSGLWVAFPTFISAEYGTIVTITGTLLSYAFMGEFMVMLTWTSEVISQSKRNLIITKRHFQFLFDCIKDRGSEGLKNYGKISDIWNWTFLCSVIILSYISIYSFRSFLFSIIEFFIVAASFALCRASSKQALALLLFSALLFIIKIVFIFQLSQNTLLIGLYLSGTQLSFLLLYWFLRFPPEKKINIINILKYIAVCLLVLLVGKKTWEMLSEVDDK